MTVTITTQAPLPGEKVSASLFGDAVVTDLNALASQLGFITPVFAQKIADESVTSSTTPQNDDHLFCAGVAGAAYEVYVQLSVTGAGSATVGDVSIQFTFPTSGSGQSLALGYTGLTNSVAYGFNTAGSVNNVTFRNTTSPSNGASFGTPSTNFTPIFISGIWVVGTVAGTLQLQWAQRVSSGTATTARTGSLMRLMRLS
jgi:hypothetical protein